MGSHEIWEQLYELSILCGMNQRYAQHMLSGAQWWSGVIDGFVVFSTVFALALSIVAYFLPDKHWTRLPWLTLGLAEVLVAFVAAVSGIILVVSPSNANVHHYNEMFHAWSDLRQDVDSVVVDADSKSLTGVDAEAYLERRYRELLAKKNSLNAREPSADQDLLEHFLALEEKSRGMEGDPPDSARKVAPVPLVVGH